MKLFNYDNVLCLSPHPDDVEYSMSGLIKKYPDTNFIILLLSNGSNFDETSGENRFNEVKKFWSLLEVDNIIILNINKKFDEIKDCEWINVIESKINSYKVDAIFGTSSEDTHYEHIITNRILHSIGRNKKVSLFEYKSPSTKESWIPNFFIEIDKFYDSKVYSLINSFDSQLDSIYFTDKLIKLFNMNYNINKLGYDKIESFKILRKL